MIKNTAFPLKAESVRTSTCTSTSHSSSSTFSIVTPILSICVALSAYSPLAAQAAPPPDSGALLQQNKPAPTATPSTDNTGLVLEPQITSSLPASAPFMVSAIAIDGNTLFATKTLHDLVSNVEGHEQTLQQLGEAVARITAYYHSHDYPMARAYIPAQTIHDGIVRVAVVEARYGQIRMTNHSLVKNDVVHSTLSGLQSGAQIEQNQLNRSLLLLSDLPGVSAASVIQPGEAVGTSDLVIDAGPTSQWNGNVAADNYGNRYTGRARAIGTLNWIDPLNRGDVLSVSALTTGNDMNNFSLFYETQIGGEGTRAGASSSTLSYKLGDSLYNIGGHGAAQVDSLWIKYPWQRSIDVNVYSQLQVDYKKLSDEIDTANIQTNRHINSVAFSLNGDARDSLLAGAVTTWSLAWKLGQLDFDNGAAQALDAQSARTEGSFMKWNGSYSRLQNLTPDTALFVALSAQLSNNNLDSAEKMVAGGAYTVRAYDMGAVSGDNGLLGNLELRQNLGNFGAAGLWQAVAFIDSERVTVNQNTWTTETNSASLSGVGLGLNWSNSDGWHARVYAANPIGTESILVGEDKKVRGWAEVGAWF